jgi:serine/threonine protein kinase
MLARYHLEDELGTGARGAVYRGRDKTTGCKVAIKLLTDDSPRELRCGGDAVARHTAAARRLRLDHPDIARVLGTGRAGLLRYVAMELAEGADLSGHARPGNLLPLSVVLSIVARAAAALEYAHAEGFVHGDVKPSNIVYDENADRVKLVDFAPYDDDLSRTTLAYLAPEVLCGSGRSAASDQFALGATLYQLACGRLPFVARSQPELAWRIVHEAPADVRDAAPEVPAALSAILGRALAKDPARRYPTLDSFARSVSRLRACLTPAPAASTG